MQFPVVARRGCRNSQSWSNSLLYGFSSMNFVGGKTVATRNHQTKPLHGKKNNSLGANCQAVLEVVKGQNKPHFEKEFHVRQGLTKRVYASQQNHKHSQELWPAWSNSTRVSKQKLFITACFKHPCRLIAVLKFPYTHQRIQIYTYTQSQNTKACATLLVVFPFRSPLP